jgi:hypothetical protein
MPDTDLKHDALEPSALGRYAFWQGRPIEANPLSGRAAREWTAGWKGAFADLATRAPQAFQAVPAGVQRQLLRTHCPTDVPLVVPGPQPRRSSSARAS